MAVFDTVAPRRPAGSHFFAIFADMVSNALHQRALRKTQAELLRLTDSELDDIGLNRVDVLHANFAR